MRRNTIFVAGGLALFVFVLAKGGWLPQMKAIWTGLPAILALSSLRLLMQTSSWATALCAEGVEASALSLMGIRLSAQGAGYISVFGPVLSEPMKIRLLGNNDSVAVATLADTGVYWFAAGLLEFSDASRRLSSSRLPREDPSRLLSCQRFSSRDLR